MTVTQILVELAPHKEMSVRSLYNHISALGIRPIAANQRPQQYPDDTPKRILKRLGKAPRKMAARRTTGGAR